MPAVVPPDVVEGPSDAELLAALRDGDDAAYGELWRRHATAGLRAARRVTSSLEPEDLVQEAFARILSAVRGGSGPTTAFRPYLYTTVRHVAATWGRARADETPVDELEPQPDPDALFEDPAIERGIVARAFGSLRPEWRDVLWYTEVEGMTPQEVAPLLGATPNAVSALAYRAREGLRTAWLQAHLHSAAAEAGCRWTVDRLGAYQRDRLPARERTRVEDHLRSCPACAALALEVDDLAGTLRAALLPLLLGLAGWGAAGGTVAAVGTGASTTGASTGASTGAGGGASAGAAGVAGGVLGATTAWVVGGVLVAAAAVAGVVVATSDPAPGPVTVVAEDAGPGGAGGGALTTEAGPSDGAAGADGVDGTDETTADAPGTAPAGPGAADAPGGTSAAGATPRGGGLPAGTATGGAPAPAAPTSPWTAAPTDPATDPGTGPTGPTDPADPVDPVPPALPTLDVASVDADGVLLPRLAGTAAPGATVVVSDAAGTTGAVLATTTAGADGTWQADVDVAPGAAGPLSVRVHQEVGGTAGPASEVLGPFALATPSVTVSRDDVAEPEIAIVGTPGSHVRALLDGVPSGLHGMDGLPAVRVVRGLAPGVHTVDVRYEDPATGRHGARARVEVTVAP